jgi:hypothetical protein
MPGLNSENSENGVGTTVFRVFRVQGPAKVPGLNFAGSEKGGGTTFSKFSNCRSRPALRPEQNFENFAKV